MSINQFWQRNKKSRFYTALSLIRVTSYSKAFGLILEMVYLSTELVPNAHFAILQFQLEYMFQLVLVDTPQGIEHVNKTLL